jgi:transposase
LELDCYIHGSGAIRNFGNSPEGIAKMAKWSLENCTVERNELLFVFEHTGPYTHELIQYLAQHGYLFQVTRYAKFVTSHSGESPPE